MKRLHAFLLGLIECHSDFTTHFDDYNLLLAYDRGRALGRFVTLGNR